MPITVNYEPVGAIGELATKAGEQAGQRWQATYDQPFQLQQEQLAANAQNQAYNNQAAMDRLNTQISSSEKLQTSENIQRLKELNSQNQAAMERLQIGDFNSFERLNAQLLADFDKTNLLISADERNLSERNKAQLDAIALGDYNTAQRLQMQIDADMAKTATTQDFENQQLSKKAGIDDSLIKLQSRLGSQSAQEEYLLRAQLESQSLEQQNQYAIQNYQFQQDLILGNQQKLAAGKADIDLNSELMKYQQSLQSQYEKEQKQSQEYSFQSDLIDKMPELDSQQKLIAKSILRSNIYGYDTSATSAGLPTTTSDISRQKAQFDQWYKKQRLGQYGQTADLNQQKYQTKTAQEQQKINLNTQKLAQLATKLQYTQGANSQQAIANADKEINSLGIWEQNGQFYESVFDRYAGGVGANVAVPIQPNDPRISYLQQLKQRKQSLQSQQSGQTTKQLDPTTAAAILQEAGGNKEQARQIALQRGYSF
jgi:hypothetical protein